MLKRNAGGFLLAALFLMTGCATTGTRTNQAEIDALNARVSALQGQMSSKDQEINSLQSQMADQRMAREAAEAALRNAEMEKQRSEDAKAAAKAPASDLK